MASPETEESLTQEILERVRKIARLRKENAPAFVPGTSKIGYAGRVYGEEELINVTSSALEFWLTSGRYHEALEKGLAKWYGLRSATLANSGSSANLLAASALTSIQLGERRLVPGDEVITVAAGFPTTVVPLIQNGFVPVFVDVTLPTYNIDVSKLEEALSPRTRAIMVAHTLGNPFDLGAIAAFAKKHKLWLVEDNCDAAGSLYNGKKTGTFGDMATLSFYPPHHMTTGEGGAVLTGNAKLKTVLESFRDWGRDCWCASGQDNTCAKRFEWELGELPKGYDHKYTYSHLGYNLKMTDLQASIGCAQLEKLGDFVKARGENWAFYRHALTDMGEFFVLPEATPNSEPSWFGFILTLRDNAPFSRDALVRMIEAKGIQTRMLFGGNLLRQPAMTQLKKDCADQGRPAPYRVVGELNETDRIMNHAFWIGVYPGINHAMREYVVDTIRKSVVELAGKRSLAVV